MEAYEDRCHFLSLKVQSRTFQYGSHCMLLLSTWNLAYLNGDVLDFFENYCKKSVKYEYFINNLKYYMLNWLHFRHIELNKICNYFF